MNRICALILGVCVAMVAVSARAQVSTNPNNTIVRFDFFTYGTNFGSVDIELFDQDKPETVRNFLAYVYSGQYSNLLVHRLAKGFVMQAGHAIIDNPESSAEFTSYRRPREFGNVTNEFSVGPTLSNVFGTIAMARVGGLPDSASTDWFINLRDNLGLDETDGGFTVFGRVINTSAPLNGTNLLNALRDYTNVVSKNVTEPADTLPELPVSANHAPVQVRDLLTVRATIVRGAAGEQEPPSLSIVSPAADSLTTTNVRLHASGTSSDNSGVWRVLYEDGFVRRVASGAANWTADVQLSLGTNVISFWAVDIFGNESTHVQRTVVCEARSENNTVVRLDFRTGGTNFGTIDLELFDAFKPLSVRNFLLYIFSGAYSNTAMYSLTPSNRLLAGHVKLAKPDATNDFVKYDLPTDFGGIVNEFETGPRLTNGFGTLGLTRTTGSAAGSMDWFINLNDNVDRDVADGGDPVFGRVINTSGPNTGTNLLNFFRSYTNTQFKLIFSPLEVLSQLPVSVTRFAYTTNYTTNTTGGVTNVVTSVVTNVAPVQHRDLFTIVASIINSPIRDKSAPKIKVAGRASTLVTTNSTVNFSGTADDNLEVARVLYDAGDGNQILPGGSSWSTDIQLVPGTNTIVFSSLDWFANQSTKVVRKVFYRVPTPIHLTNIGGGTVLGAVNEQKLDIGRNYTLTARPSARNFFVGWRGTFSLAAPRIIFAMRENLALTAVFATNPFPQLSGSYFGLMTPRTTNSGPHVTGVVSLNLGPRGIYNGRLQPLGASYPIRGIFNLGNVSTIGGKRGNSPLTLALAISTNGPAQIQGFYSDGDEVADVQMYRFERANGAVPQAGHFTLALAPQAGSVIGSGFGGGTVDISDGGNVAMNGTTPDGQDFSQSTTLYSGAHFPLLVKRGNGDALLGWLGFATNNATFNGGLRWVNSGVFQNPFGEALEVTGSRFTPPEAGQSYLGWTNGAIVLEGADLAEPIEVPCTIDGEISVGTNDVSLNLSAGADGRISGSFVNPTTQATTPLQGVFLQSSNLATGFFLGTNGSGALRLRSN